MVREWSATHVRSTMIKDRLLGEGGLFMLLLALGATAFGILDGQEAYKDIRLTCLPAPQSSKDS